MCIVSAKHKKIVTDSSDLTDGILVVRGHGRTDWLISIFHLSLLKGPSDAHVNNVEESAFSLKLDWSDCENYLPSQFSV